MITVGRSEKGPIDKLLLKQLGESIRLKKNYLKHLNRVYHQNAASLKKSRETRVVEAELRMLRSFVFQIHILQMESKSRRSSMVEQSPRKRQVEGSSPSDGSNPRVK
jgi:hypothetical protein